MSHLYCSAKAGGAAAVTEDASALYSALFQCASLE